MDETVKNNPVPAEPQPTDPKPEPPAPGDPKPEPKPAPAPEPPTEPVPLPVDPPAAEDTAALRADLARVQAERTAVLEAAKLGIDAKHIDYVLKLADLPTDGKPESIQKALQKVLDDVPAFRVNAPENRPELRIGTKEPKETAADDAIAKAFGNTKKN